LINKSACVKLKLQEGAKNMKELKIRTTENQLEKLVDLQLQARALPELSIVEKAKFDQSLAIDQLYYSSQLEGSILTEDMIDKAIHGKKIPAA